MNGNGVAAEAACHGDVRIAGDGQLHRAIGGKTERLRRVQLNGVGETAAALLALCEDVYLCCCNRDALGIAGIDAGWIADGIFYLELQLMSAGIDVDERTAARAGNGGEYVGRRVPVEVLADVDERISCIDGRSLRQRGGEIAARFPLRLFVDGGRGRCTAQLSGAREGDGGLFAAHVIGREHGHAVELVVGALFREILGLPCMCRLCITVGVDAELIAHLKPEALGRVLSIELSKISRCALEGGHLRPVLRCVREQIGYRRLIDVRINAATRAQIVGHHVSGAVWQYLQITQIFAGRFYMGGQYGFFCRSTDQSSGGIGLHNVERGVGDVAGAIVLLAANCCEQDVIVELVQPHLVGVAPNARAARKLQAPVILDFIVHEKAVVIAVKAAVRIDGDGSIEVAPIRDKRLAMHLCCIRIAGIRLTGIMVLIGLCKRVARILLNVAL